jgi:hypothetical protein
MRRESFDYWADNVLADKPATLEYLKSRLNENNPGYLAEKEREGEVELKYTFGKIVLRGRVPTGTAYKLTIMPKGIFESRVERNFKTLKGIIESHEIKLIRCEQ